MQRFVILFFLILVACSTDGEMILGSLENALRDNEIVPDNVIACAASNENDNAISVFFYPREGAKNIRYFETANAEVDKNDFSNYIEYTYPLFDVFNGYLNRFEVEATQEKWVIVSFEEEGKMHISNPIRLKHLDKPTEYAPQNVMINSTSGTPSFAWQDGKYTDTAIYFQVVSDADDNLLSGTYTFEKMFQYYQLENVVLNITKSTPPSLKNDTRYNFTLMGVSEDNWVNLISEMAFDVN